MDNVICPRCGQDRLGTWTLAPTGEEILLCPECEATWPLGHTPELATFTDFEAFLSERGLSYDFAVLTGYTTKFGL